MKKLLMPVLLVLLALPSQAAAAEDFDKYYPGAWRTEPQGAITRLLEQQNAYNDGYQYKIHKHDRHFFLVKSGNRLFKVSTRRKTIEEVR